MCMSLIFPVLLFFFTLSNYLSYSFIYLYAPKSLLSKKLIYHIGCIQAQVTKKLLFLYSNWSIYFHVKEVQKQTVWVWNFELNFGFLRNPGSLYFGFSPHICQVAGTLLGYKRQKDRRHILADSTFIFLTSSSMMLVFLSYLLELICMVTVSCKPF